MSEENKAKSRRVIDEAFNAGKFDALDDVVAENVVDHDPAMPPGLPEGREGLKQMIGGYRAAFPDIRITTDEVIAEGDLVAMRWTARGTHKGDLMGISPTGKQATVTGITIDRFENGVIAESWTNWDTLGLLQQLGVVPAMTPA